MPVPAVITALAGLVGKSKASALLAQQGVGATKSLGMEIFGYDFFGLVVKLIVYFTAAWVLEQYIKYIQNPVDSLLSRIFGALGGLPLFALSAWITDLFKNTPPTETEKFPFRYWEMIKLGAAFLVSWEAYNYYETQERIGATASPLTLGVFAIIISFFGLASVPDIMQKLKEMQIIR